MASKYSNYSLKTLSAEDSRTRTYLAEDLVLKRPVIFVQLKRAASEKEARAFLLHARMLGQLQHPGLLPLHDMGIHDERYFYAYRVPPGKSLLELIRQSIKGANVLKSKSRYLIHVLSQIANTLSYLHENGVTVGKLSTDSVYIGNFGEVVIQDFSKSQKFEDLNSESFQKARADDLQNLAHLGMRLWFLSPEKDSYSIREWDEIAQKLPLEFQEVLDKACLERGGRYPNTRAFQKDLINIFQDRPPSFREGDIIFTLKGFVQKNKKPCGIFIILMVIFLLTLATHNAPIGQLQKKRTQVDLEIKKYEHELNNRKSELEALEFKKQNLIEDQQKLSDRLKSTDSKNHGSQKMSEDVLNEIKSIQQEALNEKEISKNLDNKYQTLINDELRTRKKLDAISINQSENQNLTPAIGPSYQQAGDFICDYPSPRLATQTLTDPNEEGEWINNFLKLPAKNPMLIQDFPCRKCPDDISINATGSALAWQSEGIFYHLKLTESPTWKIYSNGDKAIKTVAFNGEEQFFALTIDELLQLSISGSGIQQISSNLVDKDAQYVLPNFETMGTWTVVGKSSTSSVEQPSGPIKTRILPTSTLQIRKDSYNNIWRIDRYGLFLLSTGQRYLTFNEEIGHCDTHPNGIIHFQRNNAIDVYSIDNNSEKGISLTKTWELILPTGKRVKALVIANRGSSAWVSLDDNQTYYFDKTQSQYQIIPNLQGQVIAYANNTLATHDASGVYCYRFPASQTTLTTELSNESQKFISHTAPFKTEENLQVNSVWRHPDSKYILLLHNQHYIEVWDQSLAQRTAVLAISPVELKEAFYSPRLNSIFAIDNKGLIYSW